MTRRTGPASAPKNASLRAVADLAGVSVATVSRVMSGSSHPVAEATRQRVVQAADDLGFQPNRLARALVTARSQTVGVIVHDISDPYFGEMVKGFEDGIRVDGYRLFVASSDRDPKRELEYVRAFDAYRVDAIVFAASGLTDPDYRRDLEEVAERFRARGGTTIVLSDHFISGPAVRFDNHAATVGMVEYLARLGHDRIGFVRGPGELIVTGVRYDAYRSALAGLGLAFDPDLVADGHFTIQGGSAAAAEIVARGRPTAIFCSNDLMAIGASGRLLALGVAVPGEVSVVGFDDMPLAEYGPVPLTTVRVPTYQIGNQGAALLRQAMGGGTLSDLSIPWEVVERSSAAPVKGGSGRPT